MVFRRLQRSEFRAQVTVLAAVGTSGTWKTQDREVRSMGGWMDSNCAENNIYSSYKLCCNQITFVILDS